MAREPIAAPSELLVRTGPQSLFQPWLVPLGLLVAAFVVMFVPRYLSGSPEQSLIPIDERFKLHYPFLVAHIVTGTVAIVTVCLQVWPWLRERHPRAHRVSGRIYIFAGIIPSAFFALLVAPFGLLTRLSALGSSIWAVVTIWVTWVGFLGARSAQWDRHRKYMLYSFGLTLGVLTGRLFFLSTWYGLAPLISNETVLLTVAQFAGFWLNWIATVGLVAWWLRRSAGKRENAAIGGSD